MDVNLNSNIGVPTLNSNNNFLLTNPRIIVVLFVIIMLYLFLFSFLETSSNEIGSSSKGSGGVLGIFIICIFIVLVLLNGFNYFFNVDIVSSVKNIFSDNPRLDIDINYDKDVADSLNTPEINFSKQVYHIPGNKYSYDDAKAICNASGNRLANYKEVEEAYDSGGDWCSYGWSEDQLALFPTQYDKWTKLQKTDDHKNDCGRPGINGGFIDNPNVRFGVNCYGYKPKITSLESEIMNDTPLYPKTQKEEKFEKRVSYWKTRIGDILISPFNNEKWDMSIF